MTKIYELQKCPDCGAVPEFHWKDYRFGSCSGALKCPYDHYRVQHNYWAGSQEKASKTLVEKWTEAVKNAEVKHG